ncbi:hypothetical protein SJI19_16620 [Acerihabitans sp. TG2]|uniref:hypothetical protein n=1 Tax=Acerihabitans sp. TG2 TaxID=3096008 RepID=UPI002B22B8C0|nr:hypothetical protein [Acerihabitans sp. TG2]MEA9392149.1 hypothetical protein [Acerihabitans sp. TG2]
MCIIFDINFAISQNEAFQQGALWLLSEMSQRPYSEIEVRELCSLFPESLENICRASTEEIVRPLRGVIHDLPLGANADYDAFYISSINQDGQLTTTEPYAYVVFGKYGKDIYPLAHFDNHEEAARVKQLWHVQLYENNLRNCR